MDAISCEWDAAQFLIFSDNVFAALVYYSHLGPLLLSLLIGTAVIFNNPRALINRALFTITMSFGVWVYFDLILWATEKPEYTMFFWSAIVPFELLIYAASWYLIAVLARGGKEPSRRDLLVAGATFVPIFLLAHTPFNLLGYDFSNCDRAAIEGPLIQYMYLIELFFIGWIISIAIKAYKGLKTAVEKTQMLLISIGIVLFLLAFSIGNVLLVAVYSFELDWQYEQYRLFGMPILVAFITYSAIRFRSFDLKVFTAQALVIALSILVFSQLFVRTIDNVRIITILTFALVCVLGYILIRNVRREIEQRELIEAQEKELEVVNKQQENLLHFISHEVKGYLTDSEVGFSSIAEGDYPGTPDKLKEMATSALKNVRRGVRTVMEILDASNLKKGTVNYKKETFDFKEVVQSVVSHLKKYADEKGLAINLSISEGSYTMAGDEEKIKQHVVRNLVDNAIKYTPKGTIEVKLTGNPSTTLGAGTLRFSVKDSGVGITPEDKKNLFTEGGHGKDSIKVNVHSTGYGLFIAKQVVDAHGGKIWAESEGQGKGSTFVIEFPKE